MTLSKQFQNMLSHNKAKSIFALVNLILAAIVSFQHNNSYDTQT